MRRSPSPSCCSAPRSSARVPTTARPSRPPPTRRPPPAPATAAPVEPPARRLRGGPRRGRARARRARLPGRGRGRGTRTTCRSGCRSSTTCSRTRPSTYEFTRTLGNVGRGPADARVAREGLGEGGAGRSTSLGLILGTDRRIGGVRGFGLRLLEAKAPRGRAPRRARSRRSACGRRTRPKPRAPRRTCRPRRRRRSRGSLLELQDAPRVDRAWAAPRAAPRCARRSSARCPTSWRTSPDGGASTRPRSRTRRTRSTSRASRTAALKALGAVQVRAGRARGGEAGRGLAEAHAAASRPRSATVIVTTEETPTPRRRRRRSASCRSRATPVGRAARARPRRDRSMSVALFLDGASSAGRRRTRARTSKSAPVAGRRVRRAAACGIVYGAGTSKTLYQARSWGLGAALLGTGVLVDEGGDDVYRLRNVGQGAGDVRRGAAARRRGRRSLRAARGRRAGLRRARRRRRPRATAAGTTPTSSSRGPTARDRADYHSDEKIAGSNAQGAGMGRRGDIGDGHAWAGGLGALIDVDGDDRYDAGQLQPGRRLLVRHGPALRRRRQRRLPQRLLQPRARARTSPSAPSSTRAATTSTPSPTSPAWASGPRRARASGSAGTS